MAPKICGYSDFRCSYVHCDSSTGGLFEYQSYISVSLYRIIHLLIGYLPRLYGWSADIY